MMKTFTLTKVAFVACLFLALATGAKAQTETRTLTAAASADTDTSEEKVPSGTIDLSSSDLELSFEDVSEGVASDEQIVGVRFGTLLIPAGATINSAYIQFTVDENDKNADPCVQTISVQETGDAAPFSAEATDLSSRSRLATTVEWTVADWSDEANGTAGLDQRTADITALVQAIVDRGDYTLGNAMAFFFEGTGTRTAESGSSGGAPELVVEATAPVGTFLEAGNDITSFVFEAANNPSLSADVAGQINGNEVTVNLPVGTDLAALVPTFEVSTNATAEPASGVARNFGKGVSYTVTAEAGFVNQVSVLVNVVNEVFADDLSADPVSNGWTVADLAGAAATWSYNSTFDNMEMSAFTGGGCEEADDWLITPAIDFDAVGVAQMTINVEGDFSGTDLQVLYGPASANPDPATFTAIETLAIADASGSREDVIVELGDLTGTGSIAFRYLGPAGSCARWRFNSILITEKLPLTLQLLHYADIDGNGETALRAVEFFSALVDGFQADADLAANTLTVHSGDIIIPGPRLYAAEAPNVSALTGTDAPGSADIVFSNLFGVQAATIGNHDLDLGPEGLAAAAFMPGSGGYMGSDYPWLTANADITNEPALSDYLTEGGQPAASIKNKIAPYTIAYVGGQPVGIVGATVPTLVNITSEGNITVTPALDGDGDYVVADLAAAIQPAVDALKAEGINKIIMISHLQSISVEKELATLLNGVDIIVAGGSNTRMGNTEAGPVYADGIVDDGTFAEAYPFTATSAATEPVLVVNVDADYKYLGRLVVDFDAEGLVDLTSIDPAVSSAYAASEANAVTTLGFTPNADVVALRDALNVRIAETFGNIAGYTDVYLEGRRERVRSEETNLGNLTADANLWYANELEDFGETGVTVDVSLKNGGGIRSEIGRFLVPSGGSEGTFEPPVNGEVSEGNIAVALRFDNDLTRLTLTATELANVVEFAVGSGGFAHIGGMDVTFDRRNDEAPLRGLVVTGEDGTLNDVVVADGVIQGDANRTFNMVTLNFLADGGSGYPLTDEDLSAASRVDYPAAFPTYEGQFTFTSQATTDPGGEQAALAEYLVTFHGTAGEAFNVAETPNVFDQRIKQLQFYMGEEADAPAFTDTETLEVIGTFAVPGGAANFDAGAAEIPAWDPARDQVFFTDANANAVHVLDLSDPTAPALASTISLTGGPNSVAVYGDLVAVAVEAAVKQDPGKVEFFDANDFSKLGEVTVGALPDMVTFNGDGTLVLTANEGEPNDAYDVDPEGSISVITLNSADVSASTVATADFNSFDADIATLRADGIRIFGPGATVSQDLEPEYITIVGNTAFVTCQENNALAIVDITTPSAPVVSSLLPLGYRNHSISGFGFDPTNRDGQALLYTVPTYGMYQPDAIASYEVGGVPYLVTANEGDARDYDGYSEEERVAGLNLDPTIYELPYALQDENFLGRLNSTTATGDTDGDGDIDQIYSYGTRSFTIWNGNTGEVVWDSENALEQLIKQRIPANFNATNDENNFDNRSDDKGPEPEGVTVGQIDSRWYAFVGLERIGGIVVYDITDPTAPTFVAYENNRDFSVAFDENAEGDPAPTDAQLAAAGDLGPEGLVFIPSAESPNGQNLLVVTNEVSGTVTVMQLGEVVVPVGLGEVLAAGTRMYPVPASGRLTIESSTAKMAELALISLEGRVVKRMVPATPGGRVEFDLSGVAAGMYLMQVLDAETGIRFSQRVVKN